MKYMRTQNAWQTVLFNHVSCRIYKRTFDFKWSNKTMAEQTAGKKKWQPKRADWKAGSSEDGTTDLRGKTMAEVEALTAEGKVKKEMEAKV